MKPEVNPRRTNLKAIPLKPNTDESDPFWPDYAEPGAICQHPGLKNMLMIACPGCGLVSGMVCGNPKPSESPSWLLEGSLARLESVSLSPSINCIGCCGWHGYLKTGVYTTC